jgi:elongation factor G
MATQCRCKFQSVRKIPSGVLSIFIENKAIVWNEADQGMTWTEIPIPEELPKADVELWRGKLMESVAEYDDDLMKYFDDPDTITKAELIEAIRKATVDHMKITPMMCGSAFKNKGVQAVLDAVCQFLPSPLDIEFS